MGIRLIDQGVVVLCSPGTQQSDTKRQGLLERLLDAVKQVRRNQNTRPILILPVICLCAQFEAVLQHGLRRTSGLALTAAALKQAAGFSNKTETELTFWFYVKELLNRHEAQRFYALRQESTQGLGSLWKESTQGVSSLLREIGTVTSSAAAGVVPGFTQRADASDPLPVLPRSASADSGLRRERRRRKKAARHEEEPHGAHGRQRLHHRGDHRCHRPGVLVGSVSSVSTWSPLQVRAEHCGSNILIPVAQADQQPETWFTCCVLRDLVHLGVFSETWFTWRPVNSVEDAVAFPGRRGSGGPEGTWQGVRSQLQFTMESSPPAQPAPLSTIRPTPGLPEAMTLVELRQAIVALMNRKDESLRSLLDGEMEHSAVLRQETDSLSKKLAELEERHSARVQALGSINSLHPTSLIGYTAGAGSVLPDPLTAGPAESQVSTFPARANLAPSIGSYKYTGSEERPDGCGGGGGEGAGRQGLTASRRSSRSSSDGGQFYSRGSPDTPGVDVQRRWFLRSEFRAC
ncbi:hypothetical protein NHX12_025196 [Muraenolepis orangiensis]|uniref:Uncharacterized protein n=1 Tax=Muraenolepis orangiensis TaxID=630683 RepID=A0A9Q0ELP5_9TELE|nr:hypothetical protein NHX12_025196 [Muraenolepis orangiensis]